MAHQSQQQQVSWSEDTDAQLPVTIDHTLAHSDSHELNESNSSEFKEQPPLPVRSQGRRRQKKKKSNADDGTTPADDDVNRRPRSASSSSSSSISSTTSTISLVSHHEEENNNNNNDGRAPGSSSNNANESLQGRTSIQANKLLVEMFESFSDNFHNSHPFKTRSIFLKALLYTFNSAVFLFLLAAMWASFGVLRRIHILVECCILTVNLVINAALDTYLQYLTHTEMLRLLRARMELVLDLPPLAETRTTEMPPSSTFVRTLRDGVWRPLPMNLLVSGDVIELDPDDRMPCPVKRITLNLPSAATNAQGGPQPPPTFTLAHSNWASQTQILPQSYGHNAPERNPSFPQAPSASLSFSSSAAGLTPAASFHHGTVNPDRDHSTLSSIRSDSAAEAAEAEMQQRIPPRPLVQRSSTGEKLQQQQGVELAPIPAVLDVRASLSVASSYSATPSPASSMTSSPRELAHHHFSNATDIQHLTSFAKTTENAPPPPPATPPEVPAPPFSASESNSSSPPSSELNMQSEANTNISPPVHIHVFPPTASDAAASATSAQFHAIGSDPIDHLVPPKKVRHAHHALQHSNPSSSVAFADPQSPLSSHSSVSIDPETKERIHQTDTTFLPATVLNPLQHIVSEPMPVKSYSESTTSTASTILGDDARAYQNMQPPTIPGLPFAPTDEGPRHYIVEESPLRPQLEFILQPRPASSQMEKLGFAPPTNTFLSRFNYLLDKQKYVLIVGMALYWLFVFLRLGLYNGEGFEDDKDPLGEHTYEYIYWILYQSSLLALPLLHVSNGFWLFVLDTLGNSILLVTQEEMQNIYEEEVNGSPTPVVKKTVASLFSSASRKRAMKKRLAEAAKAKARAAAHSKKHRGRGAADATGTGGTPLTAQALGLDPRDSSDDESVSSVSSVSSSSSDETQSTESSRDSDEDELDEDAHTYSLVDSLALPLSSIARHAWDIITGNEFNITRTVNPLQVLGGITVFCCLDNEGILSENEPSADHVCFLTQPAGANPVGGVQRAPSTRQHHHRHHHQQPKVIVLDLMNDPESTNGIVIEGDEWHDQHLNSLKPLGLNAVLNNACNLPQHMLSQYEFSSTEPTTVTTTSGQNASTTTTTNSQDSTSSSSDADSNSGLGCLCTLGKEIGFDVNFIRQQYYVGKVIYTVAVQNTTTKIRPKRKHRLLATGKTPSKANSSTLSTPAASTSSVLSPDLQILSKIHTMQSMSVQDRFMPSSLHLMTNGDPFLVLFHSTHFWNGSNIQPLSEHIRTQILGIYQQWNHQDLRVLAFSYSPIFPPSIYNYVAMFNPDNKVEYVIENLNEEMEARRRMKAMAGPSLSSASSSSSLSGLVDTSPEQLPTTLNTSDSLNQSNVQYPPRRRFASEHSTIAEDNEDEHGMMHSTPINGVNLHADALGTVLSDDTIPEQDIIAHDDGDVFAEHSQQEEDVAAGPDGDLIIDAVHEHDLLEAEAGDSVQHNLHDYSPMGVVPRSQLSSPHSNNSGSNHLMTSPHHRHSHSHHNSGSNPPPPPAHPPAVPAPSAAAAAATSGEPQQQQEEDAEAREDSHSQPSFHDEADGDQSNVGLDTSLSTIPPNDTSHLILPALEMPLHASTSGADDASRVTIEAYTPKPRKPTGTAHALNKSQSFPSGFQPHISLSSMLPSEANMLHSNLQPPTIMGLPPQSKDVSIMSNCSDSNAEDLKSGSADASGAASNASAQGTMDPSAAGQSFMALPTEGDLLKSLQSSQIFLGMIAMRDQPKIEVRALVDDMKNAGIRFVFFSPDNERKTQAFGAKIGLFTEFNFYVSLKDPDTENGEDAPPRRSQGKSQLPCGVSAIRNHLQTVDNVPLLVSLFTDCEPTSCREMIRIYQENGESVMVMGSSLKVDNTQAFMQADISASLDPMPAKECKYKTYKTRNQKAQPTNPYQPPPTYQRILQQYHNSTTNEGDVKEELDTVTYSEAREFAASAAITSMPCALLLSATTDLHHFMALICEGRRLLHCMQQTLAFCMASYMTLFLVLLINFIVNAPPILNGYQILWLIWVIIPMLSLSLLHTPRELDLMRVLPDKNTVKEEGLLTIGGVGMLEIEGGVNAGASHATPLYEEDEVEYDEDGNEKRPHLTPKLPRRNPNPPGILPDIGRYIFYFFARFFWTALIYLVFYLWFLHISYNVHDPTTDLYAHFYWARASTSPHALFNNSTFQSLVLTVQNYSLCVFVVILACHSVGFVFRYDSVFYSNPCKNIMWLLTAIGVIVLQIIFCIVSVFSVDTPAVNLTTFRWYVFLPWPVLTLLLDEACKAHDRSHRDFNHKKARQHFDTVLGMHSPK